MTGTVHVSSSKSYIVILTYFVPFRFSLVSAGYSLEDIANAITTADEAKSQRMDSIRAAGSNGPLDFLFGAVETTGAAFRAIDVLGVGAVAGKGVNTVVGVGKKSSKAILDGMTAAMGGIRIARPALLKKKSQTNPAC